MAENADSRVELLQIRAQAIKAGFQEAEQMIGRLKRGITEFNAVENASAQAARNAAQGLKEQAAASAAIGSRLRSTAVPSIEQATRELSELRAEANRATTALNETATAGSGINIGGRGGNSLQRFGRELKALPPMAIPGTSLSTDAVGKITQLLGQFGVTFGVLGAAAVVATPLVIGVSLALNEVARQAEAAKRAAEAYFTSQEEISRLISDGSTRSDLQELVDTRQREYEATNAQLRTLQTFIDALEEMDRAFQSGEIGFEERQNQQFALNDELSRATGGALIYISQVRARSEELTRTSEGQLTALEELNLAMRSDEVAANDLAAEEEMLAQVRKDKAIAAIEALAAAEENRIAKLELGVELTKRAAEAEAEAAQDLAALVKDKAATEIAAAQQLADARIRIIEEQVNAESEALRKRDFDIAEDERRAGIDRAEAARKAQIELQDLEEEHREAIERINRKFNLDNEMAVGQRDALSSFAAKQARENELQDQEQATSKRQIELEKSLREENRTIDMRLREQRRTIEQRYTEQLRVAADAARKALQTEQAKQQQLLGVTVSGGQQVVNAAKALNDQAAAYAVNALNTIKNTISGASGGGSKPMPKFATGLSAGYPPINQDFIVGDGGEPEVLRLGSPSRVFTMQQYAQHGGASGATSNIYLMFDGQTIEITSRQQALNVVGELLAERID